jgi:hypothetical protein
MLVKYLELPQEKYFDPGIIMQITEILLKYRFNSYSLLANLCRINP